MVGPTLVSGITVRGRCGDQGKQVWSCLCNGLNRLCAEWTPFQSLQGTISFNQLKIIKHALYYCMQWPSGLFTTRIFVIIGRSPCEGTQCLAASHSCRFVCWWVVITNWPESLGESTCALRAMNGASLYFCILFDASLVVKVVCLTMLGELLFVLNLRY